MTLINKARILFSAGEEKGQGIRVYPDPTESMSEAVKYWRELISKCFFVNVAATVAAIAFNAAAVGIETLYSPVYLVSAFVYSNFIGTFISIVVFYVAPRWAAISVAVRIARVSFSIFVATIVGITVARLVLGMIFPVIAEQGVIPGWQNLVVALAIAFMVGFGVDFFETSQTKLRQKISDAENSRMLATEAQLASLESRIHPHFLFNTLNSIAALVREDPVLAETMVEKLSTLLRYSLDSNSDGLVLLSQELDITRKYLEIEKVRFGERLKYKISAQMETLEKRVPPLALQTLVENSIKHVAATSSCETHIEVSTFVEDSRLEIEVTDNGHGFGVEDLIDNHGLDLVLKRLKTKYGNDAGLVIGKGTVRLFLPVDLD